MRISDWSSDVCSSDLRRLGCGAGGSSGCCLLAGRALARGRRLGTGLGVTGLVGTGLDSTGVAGTRLVATGLVGTALVGEGGSRLLAGTPHRCRLVGCLEEHCGSTGGAVRGGLVGNRRLGCCLAVLDRQGGLSVVGRGSGLLGGCLAGPLRRSEEHT